MGLEVDIKKKIGSFELSVSFTCDNVVTAILGESGCGKSMTLKCIAGIETPDEGKIVLNGRVLYDSSKKINLSPQKRNIGYMFQDYALFPNMTVKENIEIAQDGRPIDIDYLERFNIAEISNLYPSQLSGGQKQRTAMARMLAANPEVILLDEPFAALDSHMRWKLEQEVKRIIEKEKKPTVFVSHNRDEVYRISEYAGVMSAGILKNVMGTKQLFDNPPTAEAAIISGCKNVAKAVKTDEYKVNVADWGIELDTLVPVPFDEGYIGVRAHSFSLTDSESVKNNSIYVLNPEIVEEPFEWTISFQASDGYERLQWKVSKEVLRNPQEELPGILYINAEKLMLFNE